MFVVDRIEENFIVCENLENKKIENFEKSKFPSNIKEGDVVKLENDTFEILEDETQKRQEEAKNKLNNLFNN